MQQNLTTGNITKTMLFFAAPMIIGNLLQQFYNIADSLIVGQFIGSQALAAVGSAYTLMTFLTSIIIGLCMGSGALFSFYFGKQDYDTLKNNICISFFAIGGITILINILVFLCIDPILKLLQTPEEIYLLMKQYLFIIFFGLFFLFLYNFFAYFLRALGNSIVPLYFLGFASVLNIILDILFVLVFHWNVEGAAIATVLAQAVSGVGIALYSWIKVPDFRISLSHLTIKKESLSEIFRFSFASSLQQSVMNFGILMIQGLVNSFGTAVMAAFAAAVKIDSFAYMPAQEFSNAYSLFISQNFGANQKKRIKDGTKKAIQLSLFFCLLISILVFVFAKYFMMIFINPKNTEIIEIGIQYLRIEGSFYFGIGLLFLLYGYFRGINHPEMSLVLTILSLGTRVILAYLLAPLPSVGVVGIWIAIPIGWILADLTGLIRIKLDYKKR